MITSHNEIIYCLYGAGIYKIISEVKTHFSPNKSISLVTVKSKFHNTVVEVNPKMIGSPREIFNYTLRKRILVYQEINKKAIRYMRRFFPQDLIII